MAALLAAYPSLRFEIVGASGSEQLVRAAFPGSLSSRVTIHPKLTRTQIAELLATSKIAFLPSWYEGFGMATAGAMACGCAAVTTPTGFGGELVDGVEALICPFGDVAAMRAAIERLLDDDELRVRIATAGQVRARMLRWETSVAKLEETYLRWLAE